MFTVHVLCASLKCVYVMCILWCAFWPWWCAFWPWGACGWISHHNPSLGDPAQLEEDSPLWDQHMLGFVINPSGPFVQMAKDKHVAVLALLRELAEGKVFPLKAIEKALGKIQWATATCPMAKPFLQPFWAWKSAVKTAGVPSSSAFPTFLQTVPSDVTLFTMVFMDRC